MQRAILCLLAAVVLACAIAPAHLAHAAPPTVQTLMRDPGDPSDLTLIPYTSAKPGDWFVILIDRTPGDRTTISADFDPRLRWLTAPGWCIGPDNANHMVCEGGFDRIAVWFEVTADFSAAPLTFSVQYDGDKPAAYSLPYTPAVRPANAIYLPSFYR